MRTRIYRSVATFISLLLLVAVPVQASPIQFRDIVNVMGDLQRGGQIDRLRLRVAQDPTAPKSLNTAPKSSTETAPNSNNDSLATTAIGGNNSDIAPTLVAGTEVAPQQQQADVQVLEQADVDGTVCDCGEIPLVGGGFPKWPFLLLIPLVCVTGVCHHHHEECENCPTPTPTPPVPEPASLLLFGSGIVALSAGARRRYARLRATKQAAAMVEE